MYLDACNKIRAGWCNEFPQCATEWAELMYLIEEVDQTRFGKQSKVQEILFALTY